MMPWITFYCCFAVRQSLPLKVVEQQLVMNCHVRTDGPRQPELVGGIPAHGGTGGAVGIRWSSRSLPAQTFLWFYEMNQMKKLYY